MRRSFPLAPQFLDRYDDRAIVRRLRRVLGHVDFTVSRAECLVHIRGPVAPYHAVDPCLSSGLSRLHPALTRDSVLAYRKPGAVYDFCLADCWSGYFVAERLRQSLDPSAPAADIVFIHLDDHTAMTSPLISLSDGDGDGDADSVRNTTHDRAFDAHRPEDWVRAIDSGVIGVGSFLTLLFYLRRRVHVRHLTSDSAGSGPTYDVLRAVRRHPALPGLAFASTRKVRPRASSATSSPSPLPPSPSPATATATLVDATPARSVTPAGTYRAGSDARQLLADLPAGQTIVHIDLDYLINDFNGKPVDPPLGRAWSPVLETRITAECRLQAFFNALIARDVRVDHWIVAASPGFCSASHWPLLLHRIEVGIQRLAAREPSGERARRPHRDSGRPR